jgi:hypothetical protein
MKEHDRETLQEKKHQMNRRLVHGSESLYGAGGMPETAVPCEPVAQGAVPLPRKKPVPEG